MNELDECMIELSSSTLILNDGKKTIWEIEGRTDFISLATLKGMLKEMEFHGTCTVIYERGLDGVIYRYGNHGEFWEKIGSTVGYA